MIAREREHTEFEKGCFVSHAANLLANATLRALVTFDSQYRGVLIDPGRGIGQHRVSPNEGFADRHVAQVTHRHVIALPLDVP